MEKISEWKKKNIELGQQLIDFLNEVGRTNLADQYLNWYAPFLIYCDEKDDEPLYIEMENDFFLTFVVPISEFDPDGWIDSEGMTFNNRIAFSLNKELRKGVWRQLSVWTIAEMVKDNIEPYHPEFNYKKVFINQDNTPDE